MPFIAFTILIFVFFTAPSVGQDNHQFDLIQITKSIKSMEQRHDEIESVLKTLEIDKKLLTQSIYEKRYRAVQNLHVYFSNAKSRPLFGFIASTKPFYEQFFEQRYQENIDTILRYSLKSDIADVVALETKIHDIREYEREKALLDKTLETALNYLEQQGGNHEPNSEINLIVNELKAQTQSLNAFILKLLNLPDQENFKPSGVKPNFILPASGVLSPHQGGLSMTVNTKSIVTAPSDGQVLFADTYKQLGNIVIMDHGHGYTSVTRGLSKIFIKAGGIVLQGEPIGLSKNPLPNPKNSEELLNKTMLYYELRYNGEIINPIEHLSGY